MRRLLLLLMLPFVMSPAYAQRPPSPPAAAVTTSPGFKSSLLGRPADWPGQEQDLFAANHNFPTSAADMSAQPWMTLDPRNAADRAAYYQAVISYGLTAFQGDLLNGCPKPSADWYHMPWMTFSLGNTLAELTAPADKDKRIGSGREPICGLTQERGAPPGFLHANQKRKVQSWAVGLLNAPGGFLLGRVWRQREAVDLSERAFPNGTFIIKYLFTEADETEVPYLAGAPKWLANVYDKADTDTDLRQTKTMRLSQIDFSVRDPRMNPQTGWVFGTFIYYNATGAAPTDWKANILPLGSMWGNDPGLTKPADYVQQSLNPVVSQLRTDGKLFDLTKRKEFGWFDRVNGPIDNPQSACLSCHSTAQVHKTAIIKNYLLPSLVTGANTTANRMLWFRNVMAGQPFTFTAAEFNLIRQTVQPGRTDWTVALMQDFLSTDYSLQLRMAIENARSYDMLKSIAALDAMTQGKVSASPAVARMLRDLQRGAKRIERDGKN